MPSIAEKASTFIARNNGKDSSTIRVHNAPPFNLFFIRIGIVASSDAC
jgi:hypothetical protein